MLKIRLYAFGVIGEIFSAIGKFLYKIINFFHLEIMLLVAILGLLFEVAFKAVTHSGVSKIIFYVLLVGSVLYAVIATICGVLGVGKKKRTAVAEIVEQPKEEIKTLETTKESEEKPKYYRVKQNKKYVMAEYSDRYELYKEEEGKLIYIRTDYK